jgi:hypothetical protein
MKESSTRQAMPPQKKSFIFINICMLLLFVTFGAHAQNFKPFRILQTIKTEYFDIIFPAESELTAYTLAGFADDVYKEINGLLQINLRKRIPVVITPDTDQFNGYMNSMTSPHIVLFDTPMDLEWTTYENALRGLFLHELTHVFSLSATSPLYDTINRIFGGWMLPAVLNASQFMVEGVTVSFESLGGFGRANDPLIKEEIRQAIYEKKDLTPFQLSGAYDLPPSQSSFYEYGGLFSAYLQQTYGMEKYSQLWQLMGKEHPFSFNLYNSGLYRLFLQVYDVSFMEAWADFLDTLALDNITENPYSIPFQAKRPFINVLASSADKIFFGNQLDRELLRYNPQTKTIEKVLNMDSSVFDIAVSPNGKNILLSSYRYKDSLATAVVTEYDVASGGRSGRQWEHLARGQYFRDGVIGLASQRHNTNIVYRNAAGIEEVLLCGNENIMYTTPQTINETWILYVRAKNGVRELCLFNYETKHEYILQSDLADDSARWKYIRNLRVSNNQIMFVYNHDDRMYKLGVIDISQFKNEDSVMNAVFSTIDFSGGIFFPSLVGEDIFYRGFFSAEDKLMQFPEKIDSLSGTHTKIKLVASGENLSSNFTTENVITAKENYDRKNYVALSYMNPFKFWFPLPLIRTTESFFSFDGLGIMSMMMDPTGINSVTLSAIGDWKAKMANAAIDWSTLYFGFPLTLSFADGVDSMMRGNSYRQTQASISGTFTRSIGNERNHISLIGGVTFSVFAENPFDNSSAYFWSYENPQFSISLGTAWSNLYRYAWQLFGTGTSVSVYYRTPFSFAETRLDGTISIALEKVFPIRFQFYGAYDTGGMNIYGNSRHYVSYFPNVTSVEYPSPNGLDVEWIAGGEAEIKVFGFEIQNNFSHLYFNRVYSSLAYRGVVYDGAQVPAAEGTPMYQNLLLAQSLILRLGLDVTLPVGMAAFKFHPNIWGAWKISNINDGKTNDFYFNVGIELAL